MSETDVAEDAKTDDAAVSDEAVTEDAATDEAVTDDAGTAGDAELDDDEADDESSDAGATAGGRGGESLLVREGDVAADYLERLLDIVDYDGDIDLDVENGRAIVAIVGTDLQALVGARGETLDALQELTRLAVQQKTGVRSRLMLDVSGHRRARKDQLTVLARETAQRVIDSGENARLSPMNPFERKVVHDAIAAIDGVSSESEGEEPNRRVVVLADA